MRTLPIALLALACLGCGSDQLRPVAGDLEIGSEVLVIEPAWVGHRAERSLLLRNVGRGILRVSLETSAPFSVAESLVRLDPAEEVEIAVGFLAKLSGKSEGRLDLRSDDGRSAHVLLVGRAADPPICGPASSCTTSHFDAEQGRCVDQQVADGVPCHSACLEDGAFCRAGACVGDARSCDDGDPCTADLCDEADGCRHLDDPALACPESAGPCRVPTCDPSGGCSYEILPDGTACGAATCRASFVCMAGACVERSMPAGAACMGPCGPGRCTDGTCLANQVLEPAWKLSYETYGMEDLALDPRGNLYWLETGRLPFLRSAAPDGKERFRVEVPEALGWRWSSVPYEPRLRVIDYQLVVHQSEGTKLFAFQSDDGELAWTVDVGDFIGTARAGELGIVGVVDSAGSVALVSKESEPTGSWLVAVDHRGAHRWIHRLQGAWSELAGRPLAAADGTVVVGSRKQDEAWWLEAVEPTGHGRWENSFNGPSARALAIDARVAMFNRQDGVFVDVGTGKALEVRDIARETGSILGRELLGHGYAYLWEMWEAGELVAVSVADRQVAWRTPLRVPGARRQRGLGRPFGTTWPSLTARGSVVVAVWSYLGEHWHLLEIDGDGEVTNRCAITGFPQPFGSYQGYMVSALLGEEAWYIHGREGIEAYHLDGLAPATEGWVTPVGSPAGSLRAQ